MAGGYGGRGLPLGARRPAGSAPESADLLVEPSDDDRTRRPADDPVGDASADTDRDHGCPVRHCWVTAPADGGGPRPGLLLEWRKDDRSGWLGRVVYPAQLRSGVWAAVEEWFSADVLASG